ncbi:alpha/beta fold hydrolase [Sedimentitalea nanhaiensis]|uniref:Pimeloyl-ACP methyl ester carboxylesterase n=1 Tax=Sedimentitalea nanhaiensis TaxID=999627 RepID=A0A1I7EAZ9_9RHOB|nr:alpha/beta hydrolase [Sedimentitalea nanhaiensis]SFU21114.1 Pimeloyl-ACP methyl ester carboxylesterase [Sedimentitalea nanhaiensis]
MSDIVEKTADGVTYLERPGHRDAMVFLHGIGSNASSFQHLLSHLPGDVRAIAWNAPGYGGSRHLSAHWPLASDYADALYGFLNAVGIRSATLVGHSLGTLIAGAFAEAYPNRVERLILASCACGYGVDQGASLPKAVAGRIEELDLLGADTFAARRAPRLVFEPLLHPDVVAQVQNAMSRVDRAGYAQAVRMLASGDLPASLRNTRVDVGFIIGINDRVTPEQQTLSAAQAWSASTGRSPEIHRINHAGHAIYQQKPTEFVQALLALHQCDRQDRTNNDTTAKGGKK